LGDNHRAWLEKSMLLMHVRDLPLIVVMPNGSTSGYVNWKNAGRIYKHRYEDLIVNDISSHVRRHFHATPDRWAIGGLSMGGYGAIRIGLKYPERFASIWGHSSAFVVEEHVDPTLADPESVATRDPFRIAESLVESGISLPEIAFDCGVDDQLIDQNRAFDAHLTKLGIPHIYNEHPGGHTWDYWNEHVQTALRQHARILGIDWIREDR
jgi:S-formylglutathione hydrolase FrmB